MKRLLAIAILGSCVLALALLSYRAGDDRSATRQSAAAASAGALLEMQTALRREVLSYRVDQPPVMDGDLSDWTADGTLIVDATTVAFVTGVIDSSIDLSAELRSRWDSEHLYFGVSVRDDRMVVDSGTQLHHDDGIELALDGGNNLNPYGADDHQYTIRTDGYLTDRGMATATGLAGIRLGIRTVSDGYVIEVTIPTVHLGAPYGYVGREIGFTIGVRDDDDGGLYDAYMIWEGNNTYNGAAGFGVLRLAADGPTPTSTSPHTATVAPSPTASSSPTATSSATLVPSSTATRTAIAPTTPTPSTTPSRTMTPPHTATSAIPPTATPTMTRSPTATPSPSATRSPTPSSLTILPLEDTYITSWDINGNYCTSYTASVRPSEMSMLMQFDLSAIPTTATVLEATLRIYVIQAGAHELPVTVHRVLRPWQPAEATWQRARLNDPWGTAGCRSAGVDYLAQADASFTFRAQNVWIDVPVTALVQAWVSQPATNYGLVMHGGGGISVEHRVVTVNNPLTELRPRLLLAWTQLAPTPTMPVTATPTMTKLPAVTASRTVTPTPTITPELTERIAQLKAQILTLEERIQRLLTILRQVSSTPTPIGGPTPTRTLVPTSTPILPPADEAAALDRRVRDLEEMLRNIEAILRQFGALPN